MVCFLLFGVLKIKFQMVGRSDGNKITMTLTFFNQAGGKQSKFSEKLKDPALEVKTTNGCQYDATFVLLLSILQHRTQIDSLIISSSQ